MHGIQTMREGQYEYIHEFRERINEILDLQKRHYEIADSPIIPIPIKQASLFELHKLTVTLSNLFDVAPYITSNSNVTVSAPSETKTTGSETEEPQLVTSSSFDYKKLQKAFGSWDKKQHLLCS